MRAAAFLLIASAALAQTAQPNVSNARLERRAFSGSLDSEIRAESPTWFGYAIKTARKDSQSCCFNGNNACGCSLEDKSGTVIKGTNSNAPVQLEGSDTAAILFRTANNVVEKIRVFSLSCPLDAGGLPFVWMSGVPAGASVSYLQKLVAADSTRRVSDGAIFAISQHEGAEALDTLIRMAKTDAAPHVRSQALFWLAQRAGQRAAAAISDAIDNDPDTEVKKRAVFALSQLPKDEGVPKLIEVARTQRNREVRKQAFFWLGQSKDSRALTFIEDVLTK